MTDTNDDGAEQRAGQESGYEAGFAELQRFVREQGHSRVPAKYHAASGFRLGLWVRNRRRDYLAGRLPGDTARRLEACPGWTWQPSVQARTEAISAYREHYRRTGSSTIPRALVCPNGFRLGAWAAGRRAAYRRGQLSDRVIGELERLPGWTWGEPQTRRRKEPPASSDTVREEVTLRNGTTVRAAPQVLFATGLRHLDEFVTERRHGAVPREYVCGDRFPLGAWIATVRTAHNRAELPPEQVVQLEERPNWHWDTAP